MSRIRRRSLPGTGLGVIVHHTDAQREFAYDARPESTGRLVEALEQAARRGWTVVSIQDDWRRNF